MHECVHGYVHSQSTEETAQTGPFSRGQQQPGKAKGSAWGRADLPGTVQRPSHILRDTGPWHMEPLPLREKSTLDAPKIMLSLE